MEVCVIDKFLLNLRLIDSWWFFNIVFSMNKTNDYKGYEYQGINQITNNADNLLDENTFWS